MNHEIFLLHVWMLSGGELTWEEIKDKPYNRLKREYDYHVPVFGKAATVHCFFEDYDIRDKDLVAMATRFMKGDYMTIEVSLYDGKVTKTKGISRINPPL